MFKLSNSPLSIPWIWDHRPPIVQLDLRPTFLLNLCFSVFHQLMNSRVRPISIRHCYLYDEVLYRFTTPASYRCASPLVYTRGLGLSFLVYVLSLLRP